ncbi:response regulator transcription factor [Mediterraneibacter gnavus]|uniref:Stage 0 sporulation protein A homolog n=1 Tax=Mediterraneibacter gnavus TaxID=33038 RepID=A0A9X3HFN3_MEDGN|nr:response regulator transcription factor [Mediterraneibacter gnavus]MCZ7694618.1 response regulator transcription factor [Mediterraneibacter gnavus]MCZ7736128.1 response regulator transcription factor [Mediterraneibacter gnavus]MDC6147810.1 response regulator transcription factor [Mediterraneibacter gnavus]MDE1201227.1 response regulator transcription factor [Mediterraneibacter gnavus]
MTQYKVMIIEDDLNAAQSISNFLETWGLQCIYLENFQEVTEEFVKYKPEIVLLDITLPRYNGYYWCEEIRKISKVPIIFISSTSDNLNMILAMNMGGDDFVIKPFDLNFLLAKINSLLRRTYDFQGVMNIIACGDVVLDLDNAKLQYKGNIMELSRNDFVILKELMTHKGKNVSRDDLMQALWSDNTFVDDNTLTVNITRVRNKLSKIGLEDFIITRKGMGYQVG